jgi:hypothetical protein
LRGYIESLTLPTVDKAAQRLADARRSLRRVAAVIDIPQKITPPWMRLCSRTAAFFHASNVDARYSLRGRTKSTPSSDFVSLAETKALMAGSLAMRQQRLEAGDMVATDEAAQMTGTSRVTMNAWIASGRTNGLTRVKRGFRLPKWQFDSPMWETLPQLTKALGTTEGWAMLAFLESPHPGLDGRTPREAIEQGRQNRAVTIAGAQSNSTTSTWAPCAGSDAGLRAAAAAREREVSPAGVRRPAARRECGGTAACRS